MRVEPGPELVTERLRLRRWRPEDIEPFATLNADERVMEFFPSTLDRRATEEMVARVEARFEERGYGLWAVELLEEGGFAGFVGLSYVPPGDLPVGETVEVGWRLAHSVWGRGYAPEGAGACLEFGFEHLGLDEIVSFTSVVNARSRRVMEKIGLRRDDAAAFDHPRVPEGSRLRPHVVYRLTSDDWATRRPSL